MGDIPCKASRACLALASALTLVASCSQLPREVVVRLDALESAPQTRPPHVARHLVSNPAALRAIATPLGSRLELIQASTARDWAQLQQAIPAIGDCPDLERGTIVGVVSCAGVPLNGHWPIALDAVRVYAGAGLVNCSFNGGTFLPNGTQFAETAYVPGLLTVLVVDVDGDRYYPD